jgi:hypothetical protein
MTNGTKSHRVRKVGRRIRRAARRHTFVLRKALSLVLSVAVLLVASQMFFTHTASRELIEQDARSYGADAQALETAYAEGSNPADAMDDVLDLAQGYLLGRPTFDLVELARSLSRDAVA